MEFFGKHMWSTHVVDLCSEVLTGFKTLIVTDKNMISSIYLKDRGVWFFGFLYDVYTNPHFCRY